jgi:hypothetical protein
MDQLAKYCHWDEGWLYREYITINFAYLQMIITLTRKTGQLKAGKLCSPFFGILIDFMLPGQSFSSE